jgi:transposase
VDPNSDPRDVRIARLERLFQGVVERAAALEQEVASLKEERQHLFERIAVLEQEVGTLKAEKADLVARLGQTSRNTSKPPSSDPPGTPGPTPRPSGRKRGGQPGHQGSERRMLKPDRIVDYRPKSCRQCGQRLTGDDPEPVRHQVFELPVIRPEVTEHRAHTLTCADPDCAAQTAAVLPLDVSQHGFGPRMTALVGYLSGRCRLSKRQVVEFADEVLGVPISVGGVCAVEQDVSATLAAPYEEAASALRAAPIVNADESGWREDKKLAWLWVGVSRAAVVFRVACSRGTAVACELLGAQFAGVLGTDRWNAYNWVETVRRQLCWSHLLRDFQGMVDRGGVGGTLAIQLQEEAEKMFDWWHRVCDGELERTDFQQRMVPVRAAIVGFLREAVQRAETKTAGMCKQILKFEPALWTFVATEGVEPTNNVAERAIRPAVLWRKGSFGNDSAAGSRFSERILTAVATVRLRRGRVLDYLAEACASYRATRMTPSLLTVAAAE